MSSLTVVLFACLAVFASAKPSGILGGIAGIVPAGPTTLIGASGVVGPNGAAGPTGIVTPNGAIGPNGIGSAIGLGALGVAGPAIAAAAPLGAVGIAGAGLVGLGALDDGQWRGEGLLASQDLTGQAARAISATRAAAVLGHGIGLRGW